MKKLFLMAVMALATVSSFAQHAVGTFTIQPKVGLNLANVTDGDGDIRVGAVAGAEFEYQIATSSASRQVLSTLCRDARAR